jgi:HK97 gp10 family phage protein
MPDTQFELKGIDELLGKFASIKNDVKYKGGRFALRKAANLVANAAKTSAATIDDPATGRSIQSNIAVRFSNRTFKRSGNLMFRVGVLHGAQLKIGGDISPKAPTPHWRLIEFGTEKMSAQPFMRPALENNIGAATNEFIGQYKKAIDRSIKKAAKARI